jgi:hypothetical protein
LRLPALKDGDAAGVEQVGRDGKVEAASCPASLLDDAQRSAPMVIVSGHITVDPEQRESCLAACVTGPRLRESSSHWGGPLMALASVASGGAPVSLRARYD